MRKKNRIGRVIFIFHLKFIKASSLMILLLIGNLLLAQTSILTWNFSAVNGAVSKTASTIATGISSASPSTVATRGDGINTDNWSNGLGGCSIDKLSATDALTAKDYITFTVTPIYGKVISISSIQFKAQSQNVARNFALYSSITGFGAGKELGVITSDGSLKTINITQLNNISSPIEFRIAIYGVADAWTNASLGESGAHTTSDLIVNGEVTDKVPDTQAPTVPANVKASSITPIGCLLSWEPSTDNEIMDSYEVFQDGVSIGKTTATSLKVSGLTSNTSYSFTVKAKDLAGNISASSTPVNVTTLDKDVQAPTTPTNLAATNTQCTNLTLTWTASTDNAAVDLYEVFKNGVSIGTTTTTTFLVTGLNGSTNYSFYVTAKDPSLNVSQPSATFNVTTAKTFIVLYEAENASLSGISIGNSQKGYSGTGYTEAGSFQGSSSITFNVNVPTTGLYKLSIRFGAFSGSKPNYLSINGNQTTVDFLASSDWANYNNAGANKDGFIPLNAGANTIKLTPFWGWMSFDYITISDRTESESPTAPSNLTVSNIVADGCTLSWTPSSDNVGVAKYRIYKADRLYTTVAGNTTSVKISGLSSGTSFTLKVEAVDAQDNSASSSTNFSTLSTYPNAKYEAEDFLVEGQAFISDTTMNSISFQPLTVYSGTGYVTNFTDKNTEKVTFTINAPHDGNYDIFIASSGDNGLRQINLGINGTVYSNSPVLLGGSSFFEQKVSNITLKNGVNTISVSGGCCYNLDYIRLVDASTPDSQKPTVSNVNSTNYSDGILLKWTGNDNNGVKTYDLYNGDTFVATINHRAIAEQSYRFNNLLPFNDYILSVVAKDYAGNASDKVSFTTSTGGVVTLPNSLKFEAENGIYTGAAVLNSQAGYSGNGYVGNFASGSSLKMTITVPKTGSYNLLVHYSTAGSYKYNDVFVNGSPIGSYFPNSTLTWSDVNFGNIDLQAGDNKIEFISNWGSYMIDYVTIASGTVPQATTPKAMSIGTNFWFAASWSGETPIRSDVNWATAYTNGDNIWNADYLNDVAPFSTLRFMDWGATNNSNLKTWSQRRLPTDPNNSYSYDHIDSNNPGGLAYEWMIDLCNRTNTNLWVCIPHQADDDFSFQLATLIKNNLKPTLKCYVEYSNEVWNVSFQQNSYASAQATALKLAGGVPDYYVYAACRVFSQFQTVFAGTTGRFVKVLAGSAGDVGLISKHISNLYSPVLNPNKLKIDAYAIAPYFGAGVDGSSANAVTDLNTAINASAEMSKFHYNYLKSLNISMVAYEGGQHVLKFASDINRRPEMYDLYTTYVNKVMRPYFTLFMNYALTGLSSYGGNWGVKEFTGQSITTAHKYRALVDAMNFMKDAEAPTVPLNLAANNISSNSFTLSWTASTDNLKVASYEIFKDGVLMAETANTSYNISGLVSGVTYSFTVRAKDSFGNVSSQSVPLSVGLTALENIFQVDMDLYVANRNLIIKTAETAGTIDVYSLSGVHVLSTPLLKQVPFNFSTGTYIVKLKTNSGVCTKKIINHN